MKINAIWVIGSLIVGMFIGFLMKTDKPPQVVYHAPIVEAKERPKPEICPVCPACPKQKRGIPPSYVKELLEDCRAGKLDQSDPDVTIRK